MLRQRRERMTVRTTRLSELLQLGSPKDDEDMEEWHSGYFDDQGLYHLPPYSNILYPDEWIHRPDLVKQAERQGIRIPEDPEIDTRTPF